MSLSKRLIRTNDTGGGNDSVPTNLTFAGSLVTTTAESRYLHVTENGEHFYARQNTSRYWYRFTMSTPWDVTSAVSDQSFFSSQDGNRGFTMNNAGTRFYAAANVQPFINTKATTNYSISSGLTYSGFQLISNGACWGIFRISQDGNFMYAGPGSNSKLRQWSLTTNDELSGSFVDISNTAIDNDSWNCAISPNGQYLWVHNWNTVGVGNFSIYSISVNYDLSSTLTFVSSFSANFSATINAGTAFYISPDGTKAIFADQAVTGGKAYTFNVSY